MGTNSKQDKVYYPNMDIMRYVLSVAVIIAHINILAGHDFYFPISSFEAVGGFFALSGFLMYPNYVHHDNFLNYTKQRARRILPPYVFIVVFCAVAFVAVSTLSIGEYFINAQWWKYLIANIFFLNWLEPALPCVFDGPQYYNPAVNGSLWTMKVEWCLYFSVPVFIYILRKFRFNRQWFAIAIVLISISYRIWLTYMFSVTEKPIYEILARQIFGQLAYFYCGMFIFFNKDRLQKYYIQLFIFGLILYFLSYINWITQCLFNPAAIAAITLSVCFIPININFLQRYTNISYEMYLFHYPVIQVSVLLNINKMSPIIELAFVMITTTLIAVIWTSSWRHRQTKPHHMNSNHT